MYIIVRARTVRTWRSRTTRWALAIQLSYAGGFIAIIVVVGRHLFERGEGGGEEVIGEIVRGIPMEREVGGVGMLEGLLVLLICEEGRGLLIGDGSAGGQGLQLCVEEETRRVGGEETAQTSCTRVE